MREEKMLIIVFLLLVLSNTNAYAQNDSSINTIDSLGFKQGMWRETLDDTTYKFVVLHYKDNVKNGRYTVFFSNGQKAAEGFWKNDSIHGIIIHYYRTGELKQITNYQNGSRDGWLYEYYRNGNIKRKELFKNDNSTEEYYIFYKNGNLRLSFIPIDNEGLKKKTSYFPNGKIQGIGYALNGKNHGKFIYYDLNGNVVRTEHYTHGDKVSK